MEEMRNILETIVKDTEGKIYRFTTSDKDDAD